MDAKKEKIRNYAKDLYFQVDDEGHKINTWEGISKAVLKHFKILIHFTTIQKWSKKYDWEDTFEKIKMAGIERGKEKFQEKENQIIDEKANTIADIYKSNKNLQKIAQQTLLARLTDQPIKDSSGKEIKADVGNTDLIRLIQHSETTLLNLHDKRTDISLKIELPQIIIENADSDSSE